MIMVGPLIGGALNHVNPTEMSPPFCGDYPRTSIWPRSVPLTQTGHTTVALMINPYG